MSCPVSRAVSIQAAMASSALAMASSIVSPAEKHPGRSGTTTPMLRFQCQVQWRRGNACCSLFSNPGLLPYGLHQSLAQVLLGVRNHHDACALRVCEDMMRTIDPGKSPTCLLEFTYQVSATHVYDTHANVVCKSICHDIPRSASRSFRDLPGAPDSTHGRRRWIHP